MEIIANPRDWTVNDEQVWAKFLETETGKRLLPQIHDLAPPLLAGGEINAILIRSGEVRGLARALDILIALAHPPASAPNSRTEYPPLEADALWDDGQKLEITT